MNMKLKINNYEIEGKSEEILTFLLGYEMKEELIKNSQKELDKQNSINDLMNRLLKKDKNMTE